MSKSEALTQGIRVKVQSQYVPERSSPEANQWFYAYTVQISNEGPEVVKLVSRHWIITDADGQIQEVRGEGVVGEQPVLAPGESFQYTSACPLNTSFGTMHGSYQMVKQNGGDFEAEIAPFSLSMNSVNMPAW